MADEKPRSMTNGERAWHVVLAFGLLAYGTYGVWVDDLYIPGKHSRGIHFHGAAAGIMLGAFVCAAVNLVSVAVDHYDDTTEERVYHFVARATQVAGWVLFVGAVAFSLFPSRRQW